jgi:hypothetical protein
MVRIIIVTSSFWQDLNISESNLSISSYGNCGAAPLRGGDPKLKGNALARGDNACSK